MLPLFLLPIMCGCNTNTNTNENSSEDTTSNVSSTSSYDAYLITTYRIGKRDFDTKVYLSWWVEKDSGMLCIFNTFDIEHQVEYFAIEYGKYTIITRGNDYYKGYLYEYNTFFILEIGY